MDLNEILKKTKAKSEKIKVLRSSPSIATSERPYDLDFDVKKTEDKQEPNCGQIKDKQRTNQGQSRDKARTIKNISRNKVETELRTQPRTNQGQTEDKPRTNFTFSSLTGLQRKITIFIYDLCKVARDRATHPLSIEHLAKCCSTTILAVKKTIQRLEKKQILVRVEYKNGRGGWTRYELPQSVFQELLQDDTHDKLRTKWGQTRDKLETQLETQPRTQLLSSSSYINTTTTEELPDDWENIDIEPLAEINFSKGHLAQIQRQGKLTLEIVQESINAFAFDLRANNKGKGLRKSPLDFFMGILRNGAPYAPPENYVTPEEERWQKYYAKQKEIAERKEKLEQSVLDNAFKTWLTGLTDDEKAAMIHAMPPHAKNRPDSPFFINALKDHYKTKIWPQEKNKILEGL